MLFVNVILDMIILCLHYYTKYQICKNGKLIYLKTCWQNTENIQVNCIQISFSSLSNDTKICKTHLEVVVFLL